MKKIMIYFLMLALQATSFSQKMNDSIPSVQKDYLQKSKNQKNTSLDLIGGWSCFNDDKSHYGCPKSN